MEGEDDDGGGEECPECGAHEYFEDDEPAEGYVSWRCAACGAEEYSEAVGANVFNRAPFGW